MKSLLIIIVVLCRQVVSWNQSNYQGPDGLNVSALQGCNQGTSTRHHLLAAFSVTVLTIGIIGNVTSIIVIQTSRLLRNQIAYVFITSLAVADLGVSVFITTVKVGYYVNNGNFCHDYGLCFFFHITDSLFPMTSISHLVVIGIDRWYAIAFPYKYISYMTVSKAKRIIVIVWTYSFLWTMMGIFSWQVPSKQAYQISVVGGHRFCYSLNKYYHTTIVVLIYILPITVTTCLYSIVLKIALKQAAAIFRGTAAEGKMKKIRFLSDTKAAKTVAMVFLAYTTCWLPHMVVVLFIYWYPQGLKDFYSKSVIAYDVVTTVISNILPTMNSCINPFIYFLVGTHFRNAFSALYYKIVGKWNRANLITSVTDSRNGSVQLTTFNNACDVPLVNGSAGRFAVENDDINIRSRNSTAVNRDEEECNNSNVISEVGTTVLIPSD